MTFSEQQLLSRRQGHAEAWELRTDTSSDGAERFGALVQRVVEGVYLESVWARPGERELRRAVLDDLVDLFVPERFDLFKRFVMTSPAVLTETIADNKVDREGFHPVLLPGGGRFRHIAMNAAAAERYPPLLVDLTARAVGYDVPWRDDPSGDTAADLAANRVGRDFAGYLKAHTVGELAADDAVKRWLAARLKAG